MSKGLDQLLARITQEPSRLMVDRYLQLLADLSEGEGKTTRALDLAEALLPSDSLQALRIAFMVHQTTPDHLRAYDVMIAGLITRGRHAKAEVLRLDRAKLVRALADEEATGLRSVLRPQPAWDSQDLGAEGLSLNEQLPEALASHGFKRTEASAMLDLQLQQLKPDTSLLEQAPLGQAAKALSLAQAAVLAAPELRLKTRHSLAGPGGRPSPYAYPLHQGAPPVAEHASSSEPDDLDLRFLEDLKDQEEQEEQEEQEDQEDKAPAADDLALTAVRWVRAPVAAPSSPLVSTVHYQFSPPEGATDAQGDAEDHAPAQSRSGLTLPSAEAALDDPAAAAPSAREVSLSLDEPTRVRAVAPFWAALEAECGAASGRALALPERFWQGYREVPSHYLEQTGRPAILAVLASLMLKAYEPSAAPVYGALLNELQLTYEDPLFWGIALDALLLDGRCRKALAEARYGLTKNAGLAWAQAAWERLPRIWRGLGVHGFAWDQRSGEQLLLRLLQRPRFKAVRAV